MFAWIKYFELSTNFSGIFHILFGLIPRLDSCNAKISYFYSIKPSNLTGLYGKKLSSFVFFFESCENIEVFSFQRMAKIMPSHIRQYGQKRWEQYNKKFTTCNFLNYLLLSNLRLVKIVVKINTIQNKIKLNTLLKCVLVKVIYNER